MNARHSSRPRRVLVLGGSGFVGRHVCAALCERGACVTIGSRRPEKISRRLPASLHGCERRRVRFEQLLSASDWLGHLADIDVVINCVGILRPRGLESYRRIHHVAPGALASACSESACRLIHVSALGLSATARSGFLRSKHAGELAISATCADWYIVRPSLLDGHGGFGARWLRRVARWPIHPVPAGSSSRIAVLDVQDLGKALARLALDTRPPPSNPTEREFELGGPKLCTLAEHLAALRRNATESRALLLPIPRLLARIASHLCDLLRFSPYSFGHWELLGRDNCPARNRLPELLEYRSRGVGVGVGVGIPGADVAHDWKIDRRRHSPVNV
jgi:NADH dehydrogenase